MNRDDFLGFLAAAAWLTIPMLIVTEFKNSMRKDPEGPEVFLLPTAVGLTIAVGCVVLAQWVPRENEKRVAACFAFALSLTFLLCAGYCWLSFVIGSE